MEYNVLLGGTALTLGGTALAYQTAKSVAEHLAAPEPGFHPLHDPDELVGDALQFGVALFAIYTGARQFRNQFKFMRSL